MKLLRHPPGLVQEKERISTRLGKNIFSFWDSINPLDRIQCLSCVLILLFHCWILSTGGLARIENVFLDYSFRLRLPLPTHPSIVLVEITEDSLEAIGRWPWPRHYHAVMTHLLTQWQAKAIVFDIIFDERSNSFDDGAFQQAIEKSTQVYFPVVLESKMGGDQKVWVEPLPAFKNHAKGFGHINITPDQDGTLRRIKPYLESNGQIFPYLALKVAFDYLGKKIPSETKPLPHDAQGNFFVNWAGGWRETFKHYSYLDLIQSFEALQHGLKPLVSPEEFRDKICLIGLTATGYADIKATPMESAYPALGALANVINSVLINKFIHSASFRVNLFCLVFLGLISLFSFVPFRNLVSLAAGGLSGLLWIAVCFLLFDYKGIQLYVLQPLLAVLSQFIFSAVYGHLIGNKEKLRFFYLATHDQLTGLFVMRHFEEVFKQAVREARKKGEALSIVMLDLDYFKKINDTYGHAAGDRVLHETAQCIQACVRSRYPMKEADFVARYGGEEFAVLLRKSKLTDAAFTVAERIRRSVEELKVEWEGVKIPITISAGVAALKEEEKTLDSILRRADQALYRAKQKGRNRVCIAD